MPRYSTNSESRWVHPTYRKAYVFKRESGMAFTCIDSIRQATPYEFLPKNKKVIMELLNNRIIESQQKKIAPVKQERSISDLIKRFTADIVSKLHPATQKHYKVTFKQYFPANQSLDNLDSIVENILDIKNAMKPTNKYADKMDKLSVNTVWKRMQRIHKFFEYAVDLGWIEKNPIKKSMIPKKVEKQVITTTQDNVDLIINAFYKKGMVTMALMVEFASITAMRIQEIIDLTWSHIKENRIDFIGKGGELRSIPLKPFPRVREILVQLQQISPERPFNWKHQQTPAKNLRNLLIDLKQEYPNMKWDITFHTFRKTTISRWRSNHVPVDIRNKIAGHSADVERKNYLSEAEIEYLESGFENKTDLSGKMRVK